MQARQGLVYIKHMYGFIYTNSITEPLEKYSFLTDTSSIYTFCNKYTEASWHYGLVVSAKFAYRGSFKPSIVFRRDLSFNFCLK